MKTKLHFAPDYFRNPTHPITIILIGVGGTGSLMLTRLARIDFALRQMNHPGLHVVAFDNDRVEKHNIGRQNFGINDVGENKAFTLISRINSNFGTNWEAVQENFTTNLKSVATANMFITCVDDAPFRDSFNDWFLLLGLEAQMTSNHDYKEPFYWLDLGNARKKGQFVLGSLPIEQPESKKYEVVKKLQTVVERFGKMTQFDTLELQGNSCSYNAKLDQQSLFINDAISVYAADLIFDLLHTKYVNLQGSFVNMEKFNSNAISI